MTASRPISENDITVASRCNRDYLGPLYQCDTLRRLRAHTWRWRFLVPDAVDAVHPMTEHDFETFRLGLTGKMKVGDGWDRKFGPIVAPNLIVKVDLEAVRMAIPWGAAYYKLRGAKRIRLSRKSGGMEWIDEKEPT